MAQHMESLFRQINEYLGRKIRNRELSDDIRKEAQQAGPQGEGARVLYASLTRDPEAPQRYYLAADLDRPSLLECSLEGVNVLPFASTDRDAIRHFAEKIDRAFLPLIPFMPVRLAPTISLGV